MSDHRFYISVMTPPASSGQFSYELQTFDADYNITVMATITGITAGASEINTAILIQQQLQSSLPKYCGAPRFSAEPYAATFRITRTEHVVCIWSQCQFMFQILSDTSGGTYNLSETPVLMTLAKANALNGGFSAQNFVTIGGVALTATQSIALIEAVSAEAIGYLYNNVIISTYLGEWNTLDTKSVYTYPLPGLSIDQPIIRRKNLYEMYSIPQYSQLAYDWIRHTGQLVFRFNQNYVNAGEPFALDNEVRVTFVAGETYIPVAIQRCILQLMHFGLNQNQFLDDLGGGSFKAKFKKYNEVIQYTFRPIRRWRCKRMRG